MNHPVSVQGRSEAAEPKAELLGRLGLSREAADQDVEEAHRALMEFLETAPHEMRSWAAAQKADVDEAFALLSGPEENLVPTAQDPAISLHRPEEAASARPSPTSSSVHAAPAAGRAPRSKPIVVMVALLVVVAVVFAVYSTGRSPDVSGSSATPAGQSTAAAAGASRSPVDEAKVATLTRKVNANPRDVVSLQTLGDAYFAARDYRNASRWEEKILAVDVKNQSALLALGAAQFNLGNAAAAKKHWLVVAGLYPRSAEVHYDLGFLYMSQTPPDNARMTAEWNKVVAIDPTSDLAKTVGKHLKSSTSSPTTSATPSAR